MVARRTGTEHRAPRSAVGVTRVQATKDVDAIIHAQPATTSSVDPAGTAGLPSHPPANRAQADVATPPRFRRVVESSQLVRRSRLWSRMRRDQQLMVAFAVAIPIVVLEFAGLTPDATVGIEGLLAPAMFLGAQLWLAAHRPAPGWLPLGRLWLSLAFVIAANLWADPAGTLPIRALIVPIVALAATRGGRGSALVVAVGLGTILLPLASPALETTRRQSVVTLALAAVVLSIGSRSIVSSLQTSRARLQQANARDRRHARQLAMVESVGRLLARQGPTPEALDQVLGVLEEAFGYRYPSVYTWDGHALQLGAQRNYRYPIQTVRLDQGVIGRVARSREPAFLPDARTDPEFLSADPAVTGEIAIPLVAAGELLGVLNVETSGTRRIGRDDFAIMQIVADRLAAALALGRERQKLTERAALLDRLTTFATALGSSLDPATMDDEVAAGAALVIPADAVLLVNRDESVGAFVIRATAGGDTSVIGKAVQPGEGVSGRAIAARSVVVDDRLDRASFPKAVADVRLPDVLAGMAAPMVIGDRVVGAVTWLRGDLSHAFTAQEREIAGLLAGKVGLALANARLHQQTADAAIRDPLTGLHNRRHFDATIERDDALRRRIPAERRSLRSVILFDLDHFGLVNKRYGHRVGDRMLCLFADTLRARARASDLVARYGGEEFIVILDNATRDAAAAIAEEVRATFAKGSVEAPGGELVAGTVSAGCATLEAWEVEGSALVERADVALAMAKAAGRDQVVIA